MNIFSKAKQLRKQYPNKAWNDLVKLAGQQISGKKVSSPSKNKAMAATSPKRKAPAKRRKSGVGATRVVTRTVKAKTTRRRSVGAIVDKTMVQVAVGMALTGVVQGVIDPMKGRLPVAVQKFAEPVQVILGYMISQKAKQPIIKGVGLGIMNNGVQGTVKTIMGMVKGNTMMPAAPGTPVVVTPAGGGRNQPFNSVGADFYIPLPNTVGYLSGINNSQVTAMVAGTDCEPGYEKAYETYSMPGANF